MACPYWPLTKIFDLPNALLATSAQNLNRIMTQVYRSHLRSFDYNSVTFVVGVPKTFRGPGRT